MLQCGHHGKRSWIVVFVNDSIWSRVRFCVPAVLSAWKTATHDDDVDLQRSTGWRSVSPVTSHLTSELCARTDRTRRHNHHNSAVHSQPR